MLDQDQPDMGDGLQCSNHPYTKNPGGICAFCLQEKLGKLVSSSLPLPKHLSPPSSSTSPPFRSEALPSSSATAACPPTISSASLSLSLSLPKPATTDAKNGYYSNTVRATKLSFLLAKKKKKMVAASSGTADRTVDIVFKRSKSIATPRTAAAYADGFSPRKRGGFWSFLYHSSKSHTQSYNNASNNGASKKIDARPSQAAVAQVGSSSVPKRSVAGESNGVSLVAREADASANAVQTANGSVLERKVSRSRSVGCGSRSFSGDIFERISTGFGDCTLRRVESQREGKPKVSNAQGSSNSNNNMKEMVKCGGIFGGFMIMTSSSSSSSSGTSSFYWVASSSADHHRSQDGSGIKAGGVGGAGGLVHGRPRSWGWAFASPIRAFSSKPSSKNGKREHIIRETSTNNTTPNLDAIPSLLAVRS